MSQTVIEGHIPRLALVLTCLSGCWGCFSERSHVLQAHRLIEPAAVERDDGVARPWLERTHERLGDLLPAGDPEAWTTSDMLDATGRPRDVFAHFRDRFEDMDSVFSNFHGMLHTAQLASTRAPSGEPAPPWPGFEDVWIPVGGGLELSGRLGFSEGSAGRRVADCIVLLPGFLGDNHVLRTRDLALALRHAGRHVLSLELRACGRTEARFPEITTAWGILETADLLRVDEYLQTFPEVRETGLLGFCWGANIALLTAWADGREPDHPSVTPAIRPLIQEVSERPHFRAGVLAFSPVLRFEDIVEALEQPRSILREPILHGFQQVVRDRQIAKGHRPVSGSLRDLIRQEIAPYVDTPDPPMLDGLRYLRLMPHGDLPADDKLESARIPVLIVLAANDPLIPGQDLVDFVARTANPHVAALLLPGGGHVGFAAYAPAYYLSLILNFFDAHRGPRSVAD